MERGEYRLAEICCSVVAMTVAGVLPSQGLRLEESYGKVLVSSFLTPSSSRSLSVATSGMGRVPAVSLQQQGSGRNSPLTVRNVVSTEKRDGFASISDEDYAENFRPPHITDNFDISARPSSFCAKTR